MKLFKQEGRSSIWPLICILALFCVFAIGAIFYAHHDDYRGKTKGYFGFTVSWDLSEEEKTLLEPMVKRELKVMAQSYAEAAVAEARFFDEKDIITPVVADEILLKFQEAKEWKNSLRVRLESACATAKYFELVDDNYEWCQ